jgi:photosystem II stability/assembly factor-like uncharacterized protein
MKIIKKSICLSLFMIFSFCAVYGQWSKLNSGTSENLSDICFKDSLIGFCVGKNGIVLKTVNGGTSWSQIYSSSGLSLKSILIKNDTIIVGGDRISAGSNPASYLISSHDLGQSWNVDSSTFQDIYIKKLSFGTDSSSLNIFGLNKFTAEPSLFRFRNDSLTNLLDSVVQYDFINGTDTGIVLNTDYETLLKTTDGGVSWILFGNLSQFNLSDNREPFHIKLVKSDLAFISYEYHSNILLTEDNGNSWNSITGGASDMFIISDSLLYTVGSLGKISKSKNVWTIDYYSTAIKTPLKSVFFIDKNIGFAAGDSGTIVKTTNGGGTVGLKENNNLKKR